MPRALVTGVTGQDGSYLAELLLGRGYEVFGLVRDGDDEALGRLLATAPGVRTVSGDLTDSPSLHAAMRTADPDEVYNLGAMTSVAGSWRQAELTAEVTGMAVVRLLEAVLTQQEASGRQVRFLQASSSEIFGTPASGPQDERTPLAPVTPYGVAKAFAHAMTGTYRRSRDLHASCVILYNHESPRRGEQFVTRKITRAVASIRLGRQDRLTVGNTAAARDWGFAGDYVDAMWRVVQLDQPDDYVVATGRTHTVREFAAAAFAAAGIEDWEPLVVVDPALFRPVESTNLVGDASRARERLGWSPSVSFEELVAMMVRADLAELSQA